MSDYVLNENDAPVDNKNRVIDIEESKEKPFIKSEKMEKNINQDIEALELYIYPDITSATLLDTI